MNSRDKLAVYLSLLNDVGSFGTYDKPSTDQKKNILIHIIGSSLSEKPNFKEMYNLIENICEDEDLQNNADYLIQFLLVDPVLDNSDKNIEIKKQYLDVFIAFVKRIKIYEFQLYKKLVTGIIERFLLNGDKTSEKTINKYSEEMYLTVIKFIRYMTESISFTIIDELYKREESTIMFVNVIITACLEVIEQEKLRSLRIEALECIMVMTYTHENADRNEKVLRFEAGDMIAFIFPGIMRRLHKIILADEKQGYKVTMYALRCWSRILELILNDELKRTECDSELKEKSKQSVMFLQRDENWYKESAKNVKYLIIKLEKLTYHSNPKVRLELVETCDLILKNCINNLSSCTQMLVEILLALSGDDFEFVRNRSLEALNEFSNRYFNTFNKNLVENIEDSFYNCLTALPRIILNSSGNYNVH